MRGIVGGNRDCHFVADEHDSQTRWGEDKMGRIAPLWLLRQLPNMPACHVAIEHDARGPGPNLAAPLACRIRDDPDDVALADPAATADPRGETAQVSVARGDPVAVTDLHQVAIATRSARRDNGAVAGGADRRAGDRRAGHAASHAAVYRGARCRGAFTQRHGIVRNSIGGCAVQAILQHRGVCGAAARRLP